ncbi:MAG TPA: polysaccharide deacetylase family protein [Acidobacteriaceae bacterium]|nr:polysaccharide deacetylase family protein [Acidobacteriaceae bacterium]
MKSLHLLYHELRPAESSYSYVTPCEEFQQHCALYAPLLESGDPDILRPEITFDDGHASDAQHALPTLQRFGLRATFFITAGWTGQRAGFMTWPQLRELQRAGHQIGAHGVTHALLTACSPAELVEELSGARKRLEDGLGMEVRTMSLPGGRTNRRVLQACERAGYLQVFTSMPRAEEMARAPRTVGRLNLHRGTTTTWLQQVLRPSTGTLTRLGLKQGVKTAAQHLLGDRIYASLWALGNRQEAEPADAGTSAS